MSELILCSGKIAAQPFYIESAELNIYTMEELCYYIRHNLYNLEQDLMSEDFILFVEHELGETKLAGELRQVRRREDAAYPFFMTILLGCGYLNKEELQECDAVLKGLRNKSAFQCRKIRADHYLKREMYARAITEYRMLLQSGERRQESEQEVGNVWHNLGCAYAGLFLFAEAEECFFTAAAKNQSEYTLKLLELCRTYRKSGFPVSGENQDPSYLTLIGDAKERLRESDTDGFYKTLLKRIHEYKNAYRKYSQVM
ncbi:MAG: hypothetical protein IJJ13_09280 [Lachnospiraceae bacterium]|nr:hypothetical protein [Lachnospiraceae bacterium]